VKRLESGPNMKTTIDCTTLAADAWSNGAKPSWDFFMIENLVNSLAPIKEIWAALPDVEAIAELRQREKLLGVATLSCDTLVLLREIINNLGTYSVIKRHLPSVTAAAKQTVLNAGLDGVGLLVNRTVTVRLGTTHILCTGVGDFTLNRGLLSQVADELSLSKRIIKACRINPPDYSPEYELGLLTGMVSPFFAPPARPGRLRALVQFEATEIGPEEAQLVAISLSPFESLVVPRVDFGVLTQLYAVRAHPDLLCTRIGF
jgi:hypothetical protein